MGLHRWNAKRDENELAIITTLRGHGCAVQSLSGPGVPDLLVSYRDMLELLEVKMPGEQLNARQSRWWGDWTGRRPKLVRTPHEALEAMGIVTDPGEG